jgi:hypothetical protein
MSAALTLLTVEGAALAIVWLAARLGAFDDRPPRPRRRRPRPTAERALLIVGTR